MPCGKSESICLVLVPPPFNSTAPKTGVSNNTTVQPVPAFKSEPWPTLTPSISVIQHEPYSSTTLCIVATNALLNKHELIRISKISHTGICRVVHPVNTVSDGDIVFTVSVGEEKGDANSIGIAASDLISDTIIDAVLKARGMFGIPSHCDLK